MRGYPTINRLLGFLSVRAVLAVWRTSPYGMSAAAGTISQPKPSAAVSSIISHPSFDACDEAVAGVSFQRCPFHLIRPGVDDSEGDEQPQARPGAQRRQ